MGRVLQIKVCSLFLGRNCWISDNMCNFPCFIISGFLSSTAFFALYPHVFLCLCHFFTAFSPLNAEIHTSSCASFKNWTPSLFLFCCSWFCFRRLYVLYLFVNSMPDSICALLMLLFISSFIDVPAFFLPKLLVSLGNDLFIHVYKLLLEQ